MEKSQDHFEGKEPLRHVIDAQLNGVETSLEVHGAETPGIIFSFLDTAREACLVMACIILTLDFFEFSKTSVISILVGFSISWSFWRGARSAWLSWMRLERLHRIAREEKEEIEKNREQEREELMTVYRAKGFEGNLLHQVIDVLMADQERLLRVMLQEEMGFKLNESQHPIVMGLSSFIGGIVFSSYITLCFLRLSHWTFIFMSVIACSFLGALYARFEKNNILHAGVWSGMVSIVSFVLVKAIMQTILH